MSEKDFIEVCPSEIKPKDKRLNRMEHKFLPTLPATFLILGQCGSGKSSCLWSLMSKGYVYGKKKKSVFDELIVYLGTLDSKSSFEKMPVENKLILTEFDPVVFDEYCDDLKKHQLEKLEEGNVTTIILYKMARNEVRKIASEYAENYEEDEFIEHYDRIIAKKPYNFLVWDRRRPMNKDRWTEGFDTPMPPSKKLVEYSKELK